MAFFEATSRLAYELNYRVRQNLSNEKRLSLYMVTPISWTLYIVSWPLASSFLLLTVLAYFLPTHLLRNLNLSR
ncbi:hypothetical protein, partial [Aerococcus mictus]|uniref:hypothetical protein n=1 Tax=Aerococcus mictus TaxID=2976810 RepID=UPI001C659C51